MSHLPSLHSLIASLVLTVGLSGVAAAADAPPASGTPPAAQIPRSMPMRPHQVVQVVEADSADALTTKIQEILDSGVNITAMQPMTIGGKSVVVVLGYPQMQPHLQPVAPRPAPAAPEK